MIRVSRRIRAAYCAAALFTAIVAVNTAPVGANVVWGGTTGDPPIKKYASVSAAVAGEFGSSTTYSVTSDSNPVPYGGLNSLKVVNVAGTPYVLVNNSNGVYAAPQTNADINADAANDNVTLVVSQTYRYGQSSSGGTSLQVNVSKRNSDGTYTACNVVWGGTTGDPPVKRLNGFMEAESATDAPN